MEGFMDSVEIYSKEGKGVQVVMKKLIGEVEMAIGG